MKQADISYLSDILHSETSHRNLVRGLVWGTIGGLIGWSIILGVAWWLLK